VESLPLRYFWQAGNPREWAYLQNDEAKVVRGKKWQVDQSGQLFDLSDRDKPSLVRAGQGGPNAEAAWKRLLTAFESIQRGTTQNSSHEEPKPLTH
jgi:hypothetical protein